MKHAFSGIVVGLLIGFGLCTLYDRLSHVQSVLAPPAKEIVKTKTVVKDCTGIETYEPKAKDRLDLPTEVAKNPNADVVAATRIAGDERPHTISAVYDSDTMKVSLYDRRDPLPWLAFDVRRTASLSYGIKDDAPGAIVRATGRLDLVQIKAARIGLQGSVDSDGGYFIGVGVEARW